MMKKILADITTIKEQSQLKTNTKYKLMQKGK